MGFFTNPRKALLTPVMKACKVLFIPVIGAPLMMAPHASAAVTVTSSTSAPTTAGTADLFYLPGPQYEANTIDGDSTFTGDNDQYTYVSGDRPSKILSFTTSSASTNYTLSSITVQQVEQLGNEANGTYAGVQNGQGFQVQFGTISGTTLSPAYTDTSATYTGTGFSDTGDTGTGTYDGGQGIYVTFTFPTPLTLAASTSYYFELTSGAGSPYFEMNSTSAIGYPGGGAYVDDTPGQLDADNTVTADTGEFAFVAGLTATAVPEPTTAALGLAVASLMLARRRRASTF